MLSVRIFPLELPEQMLNIPRYNFALRMQPIIRLENVWKTHRVGTTNVHALRGVSLAINQGEFVAIVGPSGSGKSTMMSIAGCLDLPSKGTVYLQGKNISQISEDDLAGLRGRTIGFVFQQFNLMPTLSAADNVMLPMMFQPTKVNKKTRAEMLLNRVGLSHRLTHRPSELSGGEQQRVAIARALSNNPVVLLADEPTGNLDSANGAHIVSLLKELHKEGTTIVLVTHDINLAKQALRRIHLRDGQVVEVD